jgi:ABC-type cobalt transport system, ATPase component
LQRPAKDLSGGEAQITALLRVLQLEPQVLLLDEPTASLDAKLTGRFENLLEKMAKGISGQQFGFSKYHSSTSLDLGQS